MGRKKLSEYPPEVAAQMRADLSRKQREAWARREQNGLSTRANGALRADVQRSISESVKRRWEEGAYADRVNGMTGMVGSLNSGWDWGRRHYREILGLYEAPECAYCGTLETLNVHHIDESHENYLLSNLQWLCVPCHAWRFHYSAERASRPYVRHPFVTLRKKFSFEYSHVLPWHPGKCARLHGHSGHLEVAIRGRTNPLGIVEDFYDISQAVKQAVVEPLDHQFLNEFLPNPTTEELLPYIWVRLEEIGLKGIREVQFSETDSSSATLTAADMVEAMGWDRDETGKWSFVNRTER